MIEARFGTLAGRVVSFDISGHAGWADSGSDIVCSAVTACSQMAANTLTEVLRLPASVQVGKNRLTVSAAGAHAAAASPILEGLLLQLTMLAERYPGHIRVLKQ